MLGPKWQGGPTDLLNAIANAGYQGVEITDRMIGSFANQSAAFGKTLATRNLEFVAFACASPSGFTEKDAKPSDLAMVEKALSFVEGFPGAVLSLGSATIITPGERSKKFGIAADFYNAAGKLGKRRGVTVAFHPSSHHNTLLGTREDYDTIMRLTDPSLIGWVPDTGHILRQHHDMMDTLDTYKDRITYLHLKDANAQGEWRMLGEGACDTRAVIELVTAAPNFNGWFVLEEESVKAASDPKLAVRRNRETMRNLVNS